MPITTSTLIGACREAGLGDLRVALLRDYRRQGLLPPSIRGKGRGQGGGSQEALWDDSCQARMKVIKAALAEPQGDLQIARRRVFGAGHWIGAQAARDFVHQFSDAIQTQITKRRPYLRSELAASKQAKRVRASTRRRLAGVAPPLVESLAEAVVGLCDLAYLHPTSPYARAASYFKPEKIDDAVSMLDDERLAVLYAECAPQAATYQIMAHLALYGVLALNPSSAENLLGPTLQIKGWNPVQTFVVESQSAPPIELQYLSRLIAFLFAVLRAAYEEVFEKTVVLAFVTLWDAVASTMLGQQARANFQPHIDEAKRALGIETQNQGT